MRTAPNEMRILLKRMREGKKDNTILSEVNENKKDMSMRDMLKITRKLNEDIENQIEDRVNLKTDLDDKREKEKLDNFFQNMNINITYPDDALQVYNDLIWFAGVVDGVIAFTYTVTPYEETSGVEFDYLPEFDPQNPDNEKIVEMLESYYDSFYKFWKDVLNKDEE